LQGEIALTGTGTFEGKGFYMASQPTDLAMFTGTGLIEGMHRCLGPFFLKSIRDHHLNRVYKHNGARTTSTYSFFMVKFSQTALTVPSSSHPLTPLCGGGRSAPLPWPFFPQCIRDHHLNRVFKHIGARRTTGTSSFFMLKISQTALTVPSSSHPFAPLCGGGQSAPLPWPFFFIIH
jgi:hypothetical protein